jgi:hypothetical protein
MDTGVAAALGESASFFITKTLSSFTMVRFSSPILSLYNILSTISF